VYPATLLTSAPLPLLKAALQAALQPLGLPRGISSSIAGTREAVSSTSTLCAGAESVLSIQGLTCSTPSGIAIVADLSVDLPCGSSLLIKGPSGCGKSTLLKCLMGLWPSEGGVVLVPSAEQTMCLPQRALPAPAQQLCSQLTYPDTEACDDVYVQQLLSWSQLHALGARQQSSRAWEQHLSPGELQRAAFARVLHHRPVLVLIDEGTSSVTTQMECHLYGLLKQAGLAWVSVGHRETLQGLHTLVLEISGDGSGGWTLRSAKQV
jgi:putative ATP-binding cassette transporter